jgi:hypothetical protein
MVLKFIRSIRTFSLTFVLFMAFMSVRSVQALIDHTVSDSLPPLDAFVSQIKNDQPAELRGIYIPEILAARVVQQPRGNNEFVSPRQNTLTQFDLASQVGSIGLLAHNNLAGKSFSLLEEDQVLYLIYGDGQISAFVVTEILRYQALEPTSALSGFRNLENDDLLTASEAFSAVYHRPGQVIFQTCISGGKTLTWGRLFVIAEPYAQEP